MKLSKPLLALLSLSHTQTASSAECGHWFSSPCVCETDIKYCTDGDNGATDDIADQHPFWKDYEGYYSFTSVLFNFGIYPAATTTGSYFVASPTFGFMNQTIVGSRTYNHRISILPPNPDANCSLPLFLPPGLSFNGTCGLNGMTVLFEGFGTGSPERDGSVVTTTMLQPNTGATQSITDENAKYKLVPIDDNTMFGSAKSELFLVTETFSFTNEEKTAASAVQDVYMTPPNTTDSTLVSSTRMTFTKLPNTQAFLDAIQAQYVEFNITPSDQLQVPMTKSCLSETCPTEEDFCEIDPRCTTSAAYTAYTEPDASVQAGPIVGIVVACFAVLLMALFFLHQKAMKEQAERNQAVFARRIAETIKLEGPDRELTPEALAEEFKKIDNGTTDGSIDKEELWNFVNSGNVSKMNQNDFNALFAALDTDGDGTVSFMEFSAYMGKCYDDFDSLKKQASVKEARGARMDNYYSGVSKRILTVPLDAVSEA